MIAHSIRAALAMHGKIQKDLKSVLNGVSEQAISNKFTRQTWTAKDLIKVAELCDMDLMFVSKDRQIMLPITDEPKEKAGDA